MFFKGLPIF